MCDYWYTYSIDWNDTDFLHLEILKKTSFKNLQMIHMNSSLFLNLQMHPVRKITLSSFSLIIASWINLYVDFTDQHQHLHQKSITYRYPLCVALLAHYIPLKKTLQNTGT